MYITPVKYAAFGTLLLLAFIAFVEIREYMQRLRDRRLHKLCGRTNGLRRDSRL